MAKSRYADATKAARRAAMSAHKASVVIFYSEGVDGEDERAGI